MYFFKEGDKEYYLRTLFNNLIEKVQNENREKVRKNKEFLDLKYSINIKRYLGGCV